MKNISFFDILIFLFVLLFVYAATSKLLDYELFVTQIGKSPLILDYSVWIASLVPVLEIIIAVLLLIPRVQLIALFAYYTVMLTFTLYIIVILNFSPFVPCSCGGILSDMSWETHLFFNICFTLLPLIGIVVYNRKMKMTEAI